MDRDFFYCQCLNVIAKPWHLYEFTAQGNIFKLLIKKHPIQIGFGIGMIISGLGMAI